MMLAFFRRKLPIASAMLTFRQTATPPLVLEGTVRLPTRPTPAGAAEAWAKAENAKGHVCACGCGGRVVVKPWHHCVGIPRFIRWHQPEVCSAWAEAENAKGLHVCGCGCGKRIRVLPRHHTTGIPRYLRGHYDRHRRSKK